MLFYTTRDLTCSRRLLLRSTKNGMSAKSDAARPLQDLFLGFSLSFPEAYLSYPLQSFCPPFL